MRIVHIITGLGDGGAEHTLFKICKHDNLNEHIVISLKGSGKYYVLLKKIGIKVYSLNSTIFLIIFKFYSLIKLLRFLEPNVVQTWLVHGDFVGGFAAKLAGIKNIVWNIRYSNFEADKTKLMTILLIKLLAKLSFIIPKFIIVVSKRSKEHCEKTGYDKKKLILIQNGYDLSILKPVNNFKLYLRKQLKINNNVPIIGNVARYDAKKDHSNLLKSLSILKSKNIDFFCVLIGPGINKKNLNLVNEIEKLNLSKNIKLFGSQKDITRIMNGIDIYVQSSRYGEGFPNVVAEAMACGTPCVVTDVGDAAFIVGKNGLVVPSSNPLKLSDAIQKMILKKNMKNWNKLINKSRLRIKENFHVNKMLSSYRTSWKKLYDRSIYLYKKNIKNTNIFFIIPRPDGGGAELLVRTLNLLFSKKKLNVKTIYFHNPSKIKLKSNEYCLNLVGPRDIRAIWYLRKIISKLSLNRPTLIHAHLTWPLYFLIPATYGMKILRIYTEHNTFNKRRKYFFLRPIERYVYSKYDRIISISNGVQTMLKKWINIKTLNKKYKVIYNGSRLFNLVIRKKANNNKLKLLSIGSLTEQKGFDIAITALALIKDRVESYTILGDGDDKEKLLALASKLGIRDKIFIPGFSDDIQSYLSKADLGLLPSRWEGFGLVATEMLSTGLSLVSSNVYGHREVVGNCPAVQLVQPKNPAALAKGILKATRYLDLVGLKKSALQAKKQSEKFTMNLMIERYNHLYLEAYQNFVVPKF